MTVQVLTFTQVARFSFILSFILKKYNNIKYKIKKATILKWDKMKQWKEKSPRESTRFCMTFLSSLRYKKKY